MKNKINKIGLLGALVGLLLVAPEAMAGTGGGYMDQAWDFMVDLLHGTGGRLIALFSFIGGLMLMAKSPMQGVTFVIVGFAIWVAPAMIEGILTAVV